MATREELLAEAYKRGILPDRERELYEEALRRGLVGEKPTRMQALGERLASGMTFGWNDEIAAGLESAFTDKSYDDALQEQRRFQKRVEREYPVMGPLAEIGGGVATGGVGAARALGAKALQGVPKVLRYAGAGTSGGAVSGAGNAEEGERLGGSLVGGVAGGFVGTAAPYAAGAVGKAVGSIARRAGGGQPPSTFAQRKLIEALQRDDSSPERAAARLRSLGPNATIADAGGQNVVGLAEAAANQPGRGRNVASRVLEGRARTQGDRVTAAAERELGSSRFYDDLDVLRQQRQAQSSPLYQKAVSPENLIPEEKFAALSGDEFLAEQFRRVQADKLSGLGDLPPNAMPVVDAVKKRLDDMIGMAQRQGQKNRARMLMERKDALVNVADDSGFGYAEARAAFAAPTRQMDAMTVGRNFAKGDAELTEQAVKAMSPEERTAFVQGVSRGIRDVVERTRDTADVTRRLFGTRGMEAKLRAAFPDEKSFRRFKKDMLAEARFSETRNKVLAGSPTARRLAEQSESGLDPAMLIDLPTQPGYTTLNAIKRTLKGGGKLTDKQRAELASLLFDQAPEFNQAALRALRQSADAKRARELAGLLLSAETGLQAGAYSSSNGQ